MRAAGASGQRYLPAGVGLLGGREASHLWDALERSGVLPILKEGRDPWTIEALATVFEARQHYRAESAGTGRGTSDAEPPEPEREWATTREAARLLRITERGVRKALQDKRLFGTQDEETGRWRIPRSALRKGLTR